MKCNYTNVGGRMQFELAADSPRDMFKSIAELQEVFDGNKCEACGNEEVRFVVRTHEDNEFFEMRCTNRECRARLSFGCNKKGGGVFPKRKNEDGSWKENNGWEIYKPDATKQVAKAKK